MIIMKLDINVNNLENWTLLVLHNWNNNILLDLYNQILYMEMRNLTWG